MRHVLAFILILACVCSCGEKKSLPIIKILDHYPSSSAVEYFNDRVYLIGDDAPYLLVLNKQLNIKDSIPLVPFTGKRIPKEIKPDFESVALLQKDKQHILVLFGSGSLEPFRNLGWTINLKDLRKDSFSLSKLYNSLKRSGLKEINIEGASAVGERLVLANRGHMEWPENFLIITSPFSWEQDSIPEPVLIKLKGSSDTVFNAVSGLCYSVKNDRMILSVSTENTRSSYEDGTIGKSYLWIIDSFSRKFNQAEISPSRIIDLETISSGFKGHKIESVTILNEQGAFAELLMVADNDKGNSTLLKLKIKTG